MLKMKRLVNEYDRGSFDFHHLKSYNKGWFLVLYLKPLKHSLGKYLIL